MPNLIVINVSLPLLTGSKLSYNVLIAINQDKKKTIQLKYALHVLQIYGMQILKNVRIKYLAINIWI